ncbi:MAG: hypothetical protein U0R44_06180 [Candidatus Micrarchaeia archaeon]
MHKLSPREARSTHARLPDPLTEGLLASAGRRSRPPPQAEPREKGFEDMLRDFVESISRKKDQSPP